MNDAVVEPATKSVVTTVDVGTQTLDEGKIFC